MIDTLQEKIRHKNFYNGQLCNNPQAIEGQSEPEIIFYKEYNSEPVEYSIVVPVFNQEEIIKNNLSSMMNNMDENYEIIVILDSCVDDTENIVINLFKTYHAQNLVRSVLVRQQTPVFETTCDNIGFVLSSGKYLLEIQADMEMVEFGYNTKLAKALKMYPDIVGVSGRCTHLFFNPIGVGKLGETIELPLPADLNRNLLYMWGTCNHSPLLIDRQRAEELGYFDEQNLFLDDSCHDFFARSYYLKGWKCGYVPIEFNAPIKNGSVRKKPPDSILENNEKVRAIRAARGGKNAFIYSVLSRSQPPIEIRTLEN